MPVKIAATAAGEIIYSEGDIDSPYGIASLSKIWAIVLIYSRAQERAARRKASIDLILSEKITIETDYEPKVYQRINPRPDLSAPDDPLTYRPFRREKFSFRLPVEKNQSYTVRDLFEAALFQSKNDAAQALADHFFADDHNTSFRAASAALAQKLGLRKTVIGDPHGLCDGDNVSTAREWMQFCGFLIQEGYLDFFTAFDPNGKDHTAAKLLQDDRLKSKDIEILLAKTATGNDRHGNDAAEGLMAIAKTDGELRFALTLSDANRFDSVAALLAEERC